MPEVRRAMESRGGRWILFRPTEWVMCSTCSGFTFRISRRNKPVEEVVTEAEKMRDLIRAVLLHGPLQEMEPAEATKEQWSILQSRRRIMMETKRCPACSGSPLEALPTCFRSLLRKKSLRKKEGSEFMAVLPSQRLKRSRDDEGSKRSSSSGLKEKKKAKSEDKEGSGSKKAAKRSSKMEDSGSKMSKEAKIEGILDWIEGNDEIRRLFKTTAELLKPSVKLQSKEEAKKMEDSESAVRNRKTKMVTKRVGKDSIASMKNNPLPKPINIDKFCGVSDDINNITEVNRVYLEHMEYQSFIKGYAEYQVEVTDEERE